MTHLELVAEDLHLVNIEVPTEQFYALLMRSRVWEYPWGVIFALGNELHIHILTRYRKRVFLRRAFREIAKIIFKEYPVIVTKINKGKPKALEFDLKMGWKLINETSNEWHLSMTEKDFRYGKS